MEPCNDKARQDFADAVRRELSARLEGRLEVDAKPGHRYGFYMRGQGWASPHNGFYVLDDCRPCLVVHRSTKYSLPEGQYDVQANIGPDGTNYANLVFLDESASSGTPSAAFLDRLTAIIRSATQDQYVGREIV